MNNVVPFKDRQIGDFMCPPARTVNIGGVVLLGAGPGDPDLLTIKGVKALNAADVVVYDRLVNPLIVAMAPQACQRIYVGKRKQAHSLPQDKICELLVSLAREGKQVVRLKGGDPFVFGRGGEELEALDAAGIPWEVIPGITAAMGCGAAAGIALTHRDCAHALTLMTAHRKNGELAFNWDLALQTGQTLAFYMGLSVAEELAQGLIDRGKAATTPVAVIANGACRDQQIVVAELATLGAALAKTPLPSPALIIVGDVVARRSALLEVAAVAGR